MRKGEIKVYNMDCLEGMRKFLPNCTIDVVVTSPPYNFAIKYGEYGDNRPRDEYLAWMEEIGKELKRVLKEEGSLFLNFGSKPTDPWLAWEVALRLKSHFVLQNVIIWVKSIAIGEEAHGHYRPIVGKHFLNNFFEYIFHFTKSGRVELDRLAIGVPYKDKSNIGRWPGVRQDQRCRGNVWFIPYKTTRGKKQHPAPFPSELPEMCIKLHGLEKTKVVLDPFMGIGNTAIACAKLGIDFIGFEINREYIDIARSRLPGLTIAPRTGNYLNNL